MTTGNIGAEKAIAILNDTLDALSSPDIVKKLDEARDNVGNEMLKMMQFLFPIVMQVQMDIIKEHGFPEGREGIVKFAQLVRSLEREDAEVARLHSQIRAYYLPPVSVNAIADTIPPDERVGSN